MDTPEQIARRTRVLIATDAERRAALAEIDARREDLREELAMLDAIAAGHRAALQTPTPAPSEYPQLGESKS